MTNAEALKYMVDLVKEQYEISTGNAEARENIYKTQEERTEARLRQTLWRRAYSVINAVAKFMLSDGNRYDGLGSAVYSALDINRKDIHTTRFEYDEYPIMEDDVFNKLYDILWQNFWGDSAHDSETVSGMWDRLKSNYNFPKEHFYAELKRRNLLVPQH